MPIHGTQSLAIVCAFETECYSDTEPLNVTIKDVAARAKVSLSTVSRVMTNRRGFMAEETRQRVLATIQELGYVPNAHASSLRSQKSKTIGVIITNVMNPFFAAVVRGIQDRAAAQGYELFICNTDDNSQSEAHSLKTLLSRKVDGVIVTTCESSGKLYKPLLASHYPLVLVDRAVRSLRCDAVVIDNVAIAQQVVDHFLTMGHQRIGFVTPHLGSVQPRRDRIEGARRAFAEHGREIDSCLIAEAESDIDSGSKATADLLALADPPTAIFALNTFQAIGSLKYLQDSGYSIPGQLSFVMFDDQRWTELIRPRISAVSQPAYAIGARAADLLAERVENPSKATETVLLNADYVERESVAPAPGTH